MRVLESLLCSPVPCNLVEFLGRSGWVFSCVSLLLCCCERSQSLRRRVACGWLAAGGAAAAAPLCRSTSAPQPTRISAVCCSLCSIQPARTPHHGIEQRSRRRRHGRCAHRLLGAVGNGNMAATGHQRGAQRDAQGEGRCGQPTRHHGHIQTARSNTTRSKQRTTTRARCGGSS